PDPVKNIFPRWRRRSQLSPSKAKERPLFSFRVVVLALLCFGIGAALVWWLGGKATGSAELVSRDELQVLQQQVAMLTEEQGKLQGIANAAESQINMERATQRKLAEQARKLTEENNRLKEDLA